MNDDPPPAPQNEDDPELQARIRQVYRRHRRHWILVAFLAGIPLAVLVIPAALFGWIPLLAWEAYCAYKIMETFPDLSFDTRMMLVVPLLLLLAALSAAITFGILWAGCYLIMWR